MNVLFWSSKCPLSANILNILRHENLLTNFKLVCVDNNLNRIPPTIKVVPTMIVVGIPNPIEAKAIYTWIQNVKFLRQNQQQILQQQQTNQINQPNNRNNGPLGFLQSEMNTFSDQFAYKDIDAPLPQSFLNVGEEKSAAIFTAPRDKVKINKNQQTSLINELANKRKTQDTEFADIMKKEQLYAVLNNT